MITLEEQLGLHNSRTPLCKAKLSDLNEAIDWYLTQISEWPTKYGRSAPARYSENLSKCQVERASRIGKSTK